jgi:hypothetical protein
LIKSLDHRSAHGDPSRYTRHRLDSFRNPWLASQRPTKISLAQSQLSAATRFHRVSDWMIRAQG